MLEILKQNMKFFSDYIFFRKEIVKGTISRFSKGCNKQAKELSQTFPLTWMREKLHFT